MAITVSQLVSRIALEGAEKSEQGLVSVGRQADNTGRSMAQMEASARRTSGGFLSGIARMGGGLLSFTSQLGLAAVGVKSLFDGIVGLGKALFDGNASLEQTQVSFKAFLGDASAANDMLKQIGKFADESPFDIPEANELGLKLLNAGVAANEVTQYMYNLGAAVAKVGGNGIVLKDVGTILGQMAIKGKITNEEMLQLAERNLPVFKLLADAMKVPVGTLQEMISNGEVGADKIKLLVGELGKFGGSAMTEQAKTFNGLLSTFQANANRAWMSFSGPMFEMAKGGLEKLGSLVSSKSFQDFATGAGQNVANVLGKIGEFAGIAWKFVQPLVDDLVAGFGQVQQIFSNFDFSGIVAGLQDFGNIIGGQVGDNINFFKDIIKDLGQWFQTTLLPVLQQAMPHFQQLGTTIAQTLLPALARFWVIGQQLMQAILPPLAEIFKFLAPIIVNIAGSIAQNLGQAINFVVPIVMNIVDAIAKFVREIAERAQPIFEKFAPIVKGIFDSISAKVQEFQPIWEKVWGTVRAVLEGAWEFIKGAVSNAWEIVSGIIKIGLDLLSGNWSQAWEDLKNMLSNVWENLKDMVKNGINTILNILDTHFPGIKEALKKPFQQAWDWIKNLWGGLGDVLRNIIKNIPGGEWAMQQLHVPGFAEGTPFAPGGLAIVGERGPELVNLPRGAQVIPNHQLSMNSGATTVIVQNILDGRMISEQVFRQQQRELYIQARAGRR